MRGLETNMRGLDVHTRDAATHLSVREGRTATGHWAPPAHICAGTGLDPTSPHLHGHWAHPSHNGTAPDRRTSATCALRMVTMWHSNVCLQRMSPPPVVAFEASPWDSRAASPDLAAIVRPRPNHICPGTGLAPTTLAPALGSPLPHLPQDWARPCHICAGTGAPPTAGHICTGGSWAAFCDARLHSSIEWACCAGGTRAAWRWCAGRCAQQSSPIAAAAAKGPHRSEARIPDAADRTR
jgi:hypothetical protein